MNVLFQSRSRCFENKGGDTIQMLQTQKYLLHLNCNVDFSLDKNCDLKNYDLIHVFNLQTPEDGLLQIINAKEQGKKVVLSTIYWDMKYLMDDQDYKKFHLNNMVRVLSGHKSSVIVKGIKLLHNMVKKEKMKKMLTYADIILPNSHAELEILVQEFNMPKLRGKSYVIPNAISTEYIKKSLESAELVTEIPNQSVMIVARFEAIKGQLKILKALFNEKNIPIVFIGKGKETPYGRACVNLAKKRGNVFFIDEIAHDKIYRYYNRAKVHVLPSLRESPGLSSLEAAVCDTNCVVSIHAPITEYFGLDAFVCDPSDIRSIQIAVLSAYYSPVKENLKKRILKDFTWEKAANKTLKAYEFLLNKN